MILLSLPNEMVYIQFHPCAYLVKLHIEMAMANLITRLARGQPADDFEDEDRDGLSSQSQRAARNTYHNHRHGPRLSSPGAKDVEMVAGPASKPSTATATSGSNPASQTKESAAIVTSTSGIPPPRYEESNKSSLGLPHHHATMSQDRNSAFPSSHQTNSSSSRRASRRPSLSSAVSSLGRTRFGYGDDEVSLTGHAGQAGRGEQPAPSPQTKQRLNDWERSGTPVPFVLGRGPTSRGARRPSVTR